MSTEPEGWVDMIQALISAFAKSTHTHLSLHPLKDICWPVAVQFNHAAAAKQYNVHLHRSCGLLKDHCRDVNNKIPEDALYP